MNTRIFWYEWLIFLIATSLLCLFAVQDWLRWDEVFGFVTGGACVWLVVRQHLLNWPIGLINNLVFFVIFFNSRLFADMGLQVVFFGLGVYGWWNWMKKGPDHSSLQPTFAGRYEWGAIILFLIAGTIAMRAILLEVNGAAPFWDAFTTALSLAAQFLLSRKRIENWYLWILADAIYVPLYVSRDLPLTAVLYAVFLCMCIAGLIRWVRGLREQKI